MGFMINNASFPQTRLRRNRQSFAIRSLIAEYSITTDDLIWPVFVRDNADNERAIKTMPNVFRYTIDELDAVVDYAKKYHIHALALFPKTPTHLKNPGGGEALNPDNLVCRAVRYIKQRAPEIMVITDVALDPYTDHGHDGLLENGIILNDETNDILKKQAKLLIESGADCVAPSDMMDGRIGIIREYLEESGHKNALIIAYSAKYASSFYGPFRDAVGSNSLLRGDKKTYQMDPANASEAIREATLDINEGADIIMVKPAMPYLDIIRLVRDKLPVPIFAYQVSGEYSMLMNGVSAGYFDETKIAMESLLCIKRAGASAIFSYFTPKIAQYIKDNQ